MLKEKEARRSTSEPEVESSRETNADGVSAPGPSHRVERPQRRRAKQQSYFRNRRKYHRGIRSNSSESTTSSRSRLHSSLETETTGNQGKGKMTSRRTDRQRPVKHSRSWADRMSDSEEEHMDYLKVVSEKTRTFLHKKCTRRMPNSERKLLRDRYPLPKVPATTTPQLDAIMKPEAQQPQKRQKSSWPRCRHLC